jgi:hypothetical protein
MRDSAVANRNGLRTRCRMGQQSAQLDNQEEVSQIEDGLKEPNANIPRSRVRRRIHRCRGW